MQSKLFVCSSKGICGHFKLCAIVQFICVQYRIIIQVFADICEFCELCESIFYYLFTSSTGTQALLFFGFFGRGSGLGFMLLMSWTGVGSVK